MPVPGPRFVPEYGCSTVDPDFQATLAMQLGAVEAKVVAEMQRLQEVAAALARENERLCRELDLLSEPAGAGLPYGDDDAVGDETNIDDVRDERCAAPELANAVVAEAASHGGLAGRARGLRQEARDKLPHHDGDAGEWEEGHASAANLAHPAVAVAAEAPRFAAEAQLPSSEAPRLAAEAQFPTSEGSWHSDSALSLVHRRSRLSAGELPPHLASRSPMESRRMSVAQEAMIKLTASSRLGAQARLEGLLATQHQMQSGESAQGRGWGLWLRLRRDSVLQSLFLDTGMGAVILLNTVVMGLNSDIAPGWLGWVIVDLVFALIFLAEAVLKVRILGLREYFIGTDWCWNMFELALVALAIFEVPLAIMQMQDDGKDDSHFSLLRIIRLFRITRIARVCRLEVFSELMVMVRGVISGVHVLGWAVVLISLPLYAVALVFRETVGNTGPDENHATECFANVPIAFFTVFRCIVGGDCTQKWGWPVFYLVMRKHGWVFGALYAVTVVFMTFGLFNVIVAIFVESVVNTAKYNDQMLQRQRLRDETFFLKKMMELIEVIWHETQAAAGVGPRLRRRHSSRQMLAEAIDMEITPELFQTLLHNTKFHNIMVELDIAEQDQFSLFQTLDASGDGKVTIDELMDGIQKLRGDARRSDIVAVHVMLVSLGEEVRELSASLAREAQLGAAPVPARLILTDTC